MASSAGDDERAAADAARAADAAAALGLLPEPDEVRRFVEVDDFRAHAEQLARSETAFRDEYMAARREVEAAPDYRDRLTDSTPQVRACNRYADIVCLDDARVRLTTQAGHDYINASWIRVRGVPDRQYIAAQAPIPHTFEAFWRMIWENHVPLVLMLTPWAEEAHGRTRVKADPYLALELNKSQQCGPFEVRCEMVDDSDVDMGIQVRKISLRADADASPRSVYHVHYTRWPDFGSVSDLGPYLHLHATVHRWEAEARTENPGMPEKAPTVNHCSAGIGRTGTYIAIDIILDWISQRVREAPSDPADLSIPDIFKQLRNQRPGMVFTVEQYVMVYQVIYYALFGQSLADATAEAPPSESFAGMDDADIYRAKLGNRAP